LNLELGGPSLDAEAPDNNRRTIYTRIGRGHMAELLRLYDFPSPFQTSPMRILTTTPLQQLVMLNSPFVEQLAAALAKSVEGESEGSAKVRALYRKVLARGPSAPEIDGALTYIHRAQVDRFAQVLLATNEEIYWP
jgi:hypothetical protein